MNPFFTIITPTIQRDSLYKTCASIDSQTITSWQHIIMIDRMNLHDDLMFDVAHPQRTIKQCEKEHHNFGNTCRHNAWEFATGKYQIILDDDNYLSYDGVLEDIASALIVANFPAWGLFPILRHGQRFYRNPPGICHVDTANIVVKLEIGRWPDINDYTADGIWVEQLMKDHPDYVAFPESKEIVVVPVSSGGR